MAWHMGLDSKRSSLTAKEVTMSGGVSEQEITRDIVVALVSNGKFTHASGPADEIGKAIGEIYRAVARAVAKSCGVTSNDPEGK